MALVRVKKELLIYSVEIFFPISTCTSDLLARQLSYKDQVSKLYQQLCFLHCIKAIKNALVFHTPNWVIPQTALVFARQTLPPKITPQGECDTPHIPRVHTLSSCHYKFPMFSYVIVTISNSINHFLFGIKLKYDNSDWHLFLPLLTTDVTYKIK